MGLFDAFSSDSSNEYNGLESHHEASVSHELIAGAAAYEAAKAYENHVAENGRPDNHAKAKEILAGFAGAFIDREVETKGLDFVDRQRAKHHAREQINEKFTEDVYQNY
ncbi:putative phosphoglycerate mutase family protein [Pisolithus orientalis]|uniref:putative phosphoglycerate mutase family protein n=1 Tax=Pisolithus orientalis TaxID=936130 RepID=UPI002224A71B|nr:putative phosphoglycerate mutase family protein [Pisolithus orientalis]KAI6025611.1 putative phosphoglycerate mutase family protein [Pisolithus orientalis]